MQDYGSFRIWQNILILPLCAIALGFLYHWVSNFRPGWKYGRGQCFSKNCCNKSTGLCYGVLVDNQRVDSVLKVQTPFITETNSWPVTWNPTDPERTLTTSFLPLTEENRKYAKIAIAALFVFVLVMWSVNIFLRNDSRWQNIRGRHFQTDELRRRR